MASKNRKSAFYGVFEAALDKKTGRFIVPINIFKHLDSLVRFTVDPRGRFLEIRSIDSFEELVERIDKAEATLPVGMVSALREDYLGFSSEGQIDGSLRLVIPKRMRDILNNESELVLVAVKDVLQVWGASTYSETRSSRMDSLQRNFDSIQHVLMGIDRPAPQAAQAEPAEDITETYGDDD